MLLAIFVVLLSLALLFLAHIAVTALWPYLTPQPTTHKDGPHE